jgi:hypothetical protein
MPQKISPAACIIQLFLILAVYFLLLPPACKISSVLKGGALVTFDVIGERYSILFKEPQAIIQVLAGQKGQSQAAIPNGKLVKGQVPYNTPWSWHIDPEDVSMAEFTIEIYDGLPSQVENELDYWLNTVKRFAPWQAKIVGVNDYR